MQPSRAIDDRAHRLAARRLDGREVSGRLMVAHAERMLAQAGGRMARWLVEEACVRRPWARMVRCC